METYQADSDFIRKIAIIFYHEKLQEFEKEYETLINELSTLKDKNKTAYFYKIRLLEDLKFKEIKYQESQRYFSLLSKEFQELIKVTKIFEKKIQEDIKREKKSQQKKEMEDALPKHKALYNQKQENKGIQTAKQKKEEYLKTKKQQNIDEKDT